MTYHTAPISIFPTTGRRCLSEQRLHIDCQDGVDEDDGWDDADDDEWYEDDDEDDEDEDDDDWDDDDWDEDDDDWDEDVGYDD